ncbi:CBM35 domain-containing protein [Shewanella aestuarii]|uniref:pectate lyase family protein n=1 Tax=Shewanella aestuarii TaxID=1028752 RepID=UPI001FCC4514|nr:carbohydrate-binding protein [Shewanella aestuarii]
MADGNYYYSVKITGDDGTKYNSSAVAANVQTSSSVTETFEENANGFCSVDGAIENDHSGYYGVGYANTDNESGKGVDYAISVPSAGNYRISFRYANGASDRPAALLINDTLAASFAFTGTGAWSAFTSTNEISVQLRAGNNLVRLQATGSSGLANIDSLAVTGVAPTAGDCNGGGVIIEPPVDPVDPTDPVYPNADCADLINNDSINWRESSLQSDQQIIQCLAESLGKPVGYGEKATGGYNPNGGSKLVIITNNKPEDQILAAISSSDHNWIVFDKDDFANETAIMMYRPYCASSSMQSALGVNEATCRDPYAWCAAKGVSSSNCLVTFFNDELNDSSLPVRNYLINSNTTIDGRGAKATFTFNGFKIGADSSGASTHQSENVIITNNKFIGVGHTEDHNLDPDMIRSTGESHDIWIHQNTFDTTGDSAFDVKVGAHDITVSFNKLINVKRAALHGSSDSRPINQQITTTIHNNLFVTTDDNFGSSSYNTLRRVPLLRRGQTHMFNNVFYGYRKDVMSLRVGARALLDDNLFMNPVNNSKGDDLADWALSLFDDAIQDGSLEINNSYVFESDSTCSTSGNSASLDMAQGSVPNMLADYNSASKNAINSNKLSVGTDLRNYVMATAGKGAKTPWLSSYSEGKNNIIAAAPNSCQ